MSVTYGKPSIRDGRRIVADEDGTSLRYAYERDEDGLVTLRVDLNRFRQPNEAANAVLRACDDLAQMEE